MALRAVTFDLWGTLLEEPAGRWEERKQRRLTDMGRRLRDWGHAYDHDHLEAAYDRARAAWSAIRSLTVELSLRQKLASFVAAVDPALAVAITPAQLEELGMVQARALLLLPPVVLPGAAEAVRALNAQGIRLAVISNTGDTPGWPIRRFLNQAGFGNCFSAFTFSDELGLGKPARSAFQMTLMRLGVQPHEAVHIGDQPELDLIGAKGAGMRMILMSQRDVPPHLPRPDAQIASLWEAPAAIAALPWDAFVEPPTAPLVE
ncbi:MAG: HAD family hydrolase [Chloroflexi bacterium]|nr:HAD family hydrolase [Chloroflexota bacterium]